MSDNLEVLVVGCGYMAGEYVKVLKGLGCSPIVIGRSEKNCKIFGEKYDVKVLSGGLEKAISILRDIPNYAIVAVDIEELYKCTMLLLDYDIQNILVEKPAGMDVDEINRLYLRSDEKKARINVAYNRRFYQSTQKAIEIIEADEGVKSFLFEFTEWESDILECIKSLRVRENILLANSSHVIDLAFFLGGYPIQMSSIVSGQLFWHKNGCIYAGAGYTDKNALFSYSANWGAPGRWAIEILTNKHRLYFKPMEKLGVQELNSVKVSEMGLDYSVDELYKPGLYEQVKAFIHNPEDKRLLSINEHMKHMDLYLQIAGLSESSIRING